MAHEDWKMHILQNEKEYLAGQQGRVISNECQTMFHKIDDLLLNIDKLTNINHPIHHEKVRTNLLKSNYRHFCFRMIKELVLEVIEMVYKLSAQIREKPIKTWLGRIEHGMKKVLWILSEYFYGLAKLEENDEATRAEKRQKLDRDIAHNISRYLVHLEEAKREIHARLPNCKLRFDEHAEENIQKFSGFNLPLFTFEQYLIDKTVSQNTDKDEIKMKVTDDVRCCKYSGHNVCDLDGKNRNLGTNSSTLIKWPQSSGIDVCDLADDRYPVNSNIEAASSPMNKTPRSLAKIETIKRKYNEREFGLNLSHKRAKSHATVDSIIPVLLTTKLLEHNPDPTNTEN